MSPKLFRKERLEMKNKLKLIIVCLCCLIPLSACSKTEHVNLQVGGIYDGYTYTSPYALFSTHLKDWANLKSVKDSMENNGATMQLDFSDKEKNDYRITASFTKKDIDAHALIEKMVQAGKAEGKNVASATTADGEECLLARSLLKAEDKDQGFGLMNVIFVRNGVVYDLSVKSKPIAEPEKAANSMDKIFGELWNRSAFRGQVEGFMGYPEDVDPRIPAIIAAGKRVAEQMGFEFASEPAKKGIMRIIGKGIEDKMTLSIGIAANENEILTTEAVACKVNDMKAMNEMQANYFKSFSHALVDEMLTISRSSDFDPDLMVLPKKE